MLMRTHPRPDLAIACPAKQSDKAAEAARQMAAAKSLQAALEAARKRH